MGLQVRRVVAANTPSGRATVVSDEVIPAVSRGVGRNITGSELWSTAALPADNSAAGEAEQRRGFVKVFNDHNYVGTGQGTTFRINRWDPDHAVFPHRTETLDYDIVLEGEIDLDLEDGEVVHLKAGDVVIMRGCTHSWVNRSGRPAVTAFILIDAAPVDREAGLLRTEFVPPVETKTTGP